MLPYEDELKATLVQLGQYQDQKDAIDKEIERLRTGITNWLELNQKSEYQVADNNGQDWKIGFMVRKNTKFNKEKLYIILTQDQLNQVVETSETRSLRCQRVVTKAINVPTAPQGV